MSNPTFFKQVQEVHSQNDKNSKPQVRKFEQKYINGFTQNGKRIYQNIETFEDTESGEKKQVDERNFDGRGKKIIKKTINGQTQQEEKFDNLEAKESQQFDKDYEKAALEMANYFKKGRKKQQKSSQEKKTENVKEEKQQTTQVQKNESPETKEGNKTVDGVPLAKL